MPFVFLLSNHTIIDYFIAMVHVGYVCVAIIHQTLTWTTEFLTCAQILMHAIAHGGIWDIERESALEVDFWKKSLAAQGNQTCVSSVTV